MADSEENKKQISEDELDEIFSKGSIILKNFKLIYIS